MLDRNYEVFGIEPSPNYVPFIVSHAQGAKVCCGYFPEATKDSNSNIFDCIAALDTMEHIEDYQSFFNEIHRLLIPNGTAIIMSPIILNRDELIKKTDFLPAEHCYLFSEKYLDEYLKEIFSEVKFTRWIVGHELIILTK